MYSKIIEILSEQLDVRAELIKPESTFVTDLGADSLDLFELSVAIEEEYGLDVPNEELKKMKKVQDVITYLENNRKDMKS